MDDYAYPYPAFPMAGDYPDHGDGFAEYYAMNPLNEGPSTSKYHRKYIKRSRSHDSATKTRSRSRTRSRARSRSKSLSQTRTKSRSHSRSRSRNRSRTHSRSGSGSQSRSRSRQRDLNLKEPGFLDAFRVMYLTPSKHKKSTTMYLATKKRQDRIQELLKSDGLGSKRWIFYPRPRVHSEPIPSTGEVAGTRDNCDQRIKVDGDFFKKYKRSKKIDADAPIAKLKRWELILYKKLGFIQAV